MKRLLSMLISIALMATSVLYVDFSAAAADDELTALAAGSDTYKAYYYLNFSDYAYFLNTYRSVYQTNLENLADNKPYQAMLTAWRVATFNVASEVDYAKKEIGYYETLLFDLLYDEQSGTIFQSFMSEYSDLTKTANSVQKALSASTFKKVSDLYGEIAKDTPPTDPQYLEALKVLKNCSTVSEAANLLGDISTLTDYAGTFYELVENMCKVQVVLDSAKEINLLLDEISKKSNDNIALQTAIAEFKGFTDDTVDRSFAVAVFSGETVLAEGLKYVAKKIYKSVLERANLYGLAVGAGQAVGKFAADTLFGTSDSVNSYYHLRAVFRFETLLRQVVQSLSTRSDVTTNTATAKQFNTGVVLLCKTYIAGLKEYKKFIQKNYHSGTLGDYVNGIPDAEYEQLMTSVDDLIASIKSAIAFNESVADRLYAENVQVYADEIYQMQIPTIDTGISKESYTSGLSTIKRVSTSYAGVIEKDTTLSANTVMYGDVCIKSSLDLNGYDLTVTGSLNHTYGNLTLNGGTLNVGGDYIGAKVVTNAAGKKEYLFNGTGNGAWHCLYMKNANDRMTVGGNFIECENGEMSKGVLRIGGNVESYNGFDYGVEHKTVLTGTQDQKIYGSASIKFGQLEEENTDSRQINATQYFGAKKLLSDMTIKPDNLQITQLDANGHTVDVLGGLTDIKSVTLNSGKLSVNGDAVISYAFDLSGGIATFSGSLNHTYGDLTLNGGTLNVGGDYIGAKVVTNAAGKKEYLFNGTGNGAWHCLYMKNANDRMTVGGNFIECENGEMSKGVLRIGGNVESYNGFDYGVEHKTVLTGTQDQKIYGSASIKFGQLEEENTDSRQINATQYFGAKKLLSDMTIKPDNLQITQLDANGHTVDVLGGLTDIKSVTLNSGKLSVNGDAVISYAFDLSGGIATFSGSLNHTYGDLTLNGGTLNVGGDYIGATVVTNAAGKKEYRCRDSYFNRLNMKNANDRMTVGGNFIECEYGEMSKGVLRIGGNVESYNGISYGTEHKTILDGQQHQTITLPTDSHFGTLQLTKDVSNYTFEPEVCWSKVIYADCAHQYVHKVLQPATCTSDGRERCTCTICGQVKEVLIPATAHDYQSEVVAATCSQSGYTQYTCTVCGYSYRADYTQPGAHSFVKTTVAATCTAAGYDCYTCSVCGSAYTTGFTAPLGHDLQVIQTDDQSESNGHIFEYLRCARCMDTATDTIRTTHVTDTSGRYVWKAGCYQDQVVQAGDCTHKKIVVRVCTVEDPASNGNCTAQLRTESEAPGHRVEQWTVTLDPTCTTDGQRTGTCTVCREEVHQVIAAAPEYGHIFQYSGSEPGVCIYTCTRCGVTERRRAAVVEAQFFDHMGAADKSALGYVYDLNKDGTINLRDYVLLQRIAAAGA